MTTQSEYLLSPGRILAGSMDVYKRHFFLFTAIALIVMSPYYIVDTLVVPQLDTTEVLSMVLSIVLMFLRNLLETFVTGALVYGVFRSLNQKSVEIPMSLRISLSQFIPIICVVFLLSLPVNLFTFSAAIALPVFYESGITAIIMIVGWLVEFGRLIIYCAVFSAFIIAVPFVVAEKSGVFASLKKSWLLTRGNRWRIFSILIAIKFTFWLVFYFLPDILPTLDEGDTGILLLINLLYEGIHLISYTFIAITGVFIYHQLKVEIEGYDLKKLVSTFD